MHLAPHKRPTRFAAQAIRKLLALSAVLALALACSTTAVKPNAPAATQAAPTTWRVVVLPTKDDRADQRAGGGVNVFGEPDLLVRTEAGLPEHLDEVVRGKLAAVGVETVDQSDSAPQILVRIESVVLRRHPGVATAEYSGTADVRLVVSRLEGAPKEMMLTGRAEREASGVRALEQGVLNELLTDTLDDVAERVANAALAVLREGPPPELESDSRPE